MSSNGVDQLRAEFLHQLEMAHARNEALTAALASVLAYVDRVGGYMEPSDQITMHHARALLAESE